MAMEEANRTEQNITAQKYIDQLNIDSIKKSIMRNYVQTFPEQYKHVMDYNDWEELEDYVNKFANSILASAGSGDILAGIIGGLIAQGHKEPELAGVQIHSYAANLLALEKNKTLIASDLLNKISSSIDTI